MNGQQTDEEWVWDVMVTKLQAKGVQYVMSLPWFHITVLNYLVLMKGTKVQNWAQYLGYGA